MIFDAPVVVDADRKASHRSQGVAAGTVAMRNVALPDIRPAAVFKIRVIVVRQVRLMQSASSAYRPWFLLWAGSAYIL
jgi:hypothetical protein